MVARPVGTTVLLHLRLVQVPAALHELVGRNVIQGRWTFQVVEEYDDTYYSVFKGLEKEARDQLVGGRRHLFEAEMKEDRRTHGTRHHEAVPDDRGPQGSDPRTKDT